MYNDTELFAGHNWKQLVAILISLLVLMVIGIGMWWILNSESNSQLTAIFSSEFIKQFFIDLCV